MQSLTSELVSLGVRYNKLYLVLSQRKTEFGCATHHKLPTFSLSELARVTWFWEEDGAGTQTSILGDYNMHLEITLGGLFWDVMATMKTGSCPCGHIFSLFLYFKVLTKIHMFIAPVQII